MIDRRSDPFAEYRREIISRLDRQDEDTKTLDRKMDEILIKALPQIHTEIALLKANSRKHGATAGSLAGLITATVAAVVAYFLHGGSH